MRQSTAARFKQSWLSTTRKKERQQAGEKPFACPECDAMFSDTATLKDHMTLHRGEIPFHCGSCDEKFTCASSLKANKRKHTSEMNKH